MAALTRNIITVGASAGGIEALIELVHGLPADLPAAIFVVLHVPSHSMSHLPAILARHGPLPAAHAEHGEAIALGRIYVAPPDHHLLLKNGHVELTRGPRENHARPAVDPLFRSAARAYGPRVAGVVLSGALGDGAVGLLAIRARGGLTVVQDPADALVEGMPRTAMAYARPDYVLPVQQMPALLARLANEPVVAEGGQAMGETDEREDRASALAMRDITAQARGERAEETTVYTCPECGGTMWQLDEDGLMQFNCHVGHAYGAEFLLGEMSEELEAALWRCVRLLVEKATLTRQFAQRLRTSGAESQAERIEEQAAIDDRHGQLIRDLLTESTAAPTVEVLQAAEALHTPHNAEPSADDQARSSA